MSKHVTNYLDHQEKELKIKLKVAHASVDAIFEETPEYDLIMKAVDNKDELQNRLDILTAFRKEFEL